MFVGFTSLITLAVRNVGDSAAGAFTLDLNYTTGSGGSGTVNSWSFAGLPAGQSVVAARAHYAPPAHDTYVFTAVVDSTNAVAESSENDNTKKYNVSAVDAPNLYVGATGVIITNPSAHQYTFTVPVGNNGDVAADPFTIDVTYVVSNGPSGDLVSYDYTGSISPGSSTDVVFTTTILNPGAYHLTVHLDSANVVYEANENDNTATAFLIVH
jgi:subtilase family serine protease